MLEYDMECYNRTWNVILGLWNVRIGYGMLE
jgi:hypothetical protein